MKIWQDMARTFQCLDGSKFMTIDLRFVKVFLFMFWATTCHKLGSRLGQSWCERQCDRPRGANQFRWGWSNQVYVKLRFCEFYVCLWIDCICLCTHQKDPNLVLMTIYHPLSQGNWNDQGTCCHPSTRHHHIPWFLCSRRSHLESCWPVPHGLSRYNKILVQLGLLTPYEH